MKWNFLKKEHTEIAIIRGRMRGVIETREKHGQRRVSLGKVGCNPAVISMPAILTSPARKPGDRTRHLLICNVNIHPLWPRELKRSADSSGFLRLSFSVFQPLFSKKLMTKLRTTAAHYRVRNIVSVRLNRNLTTKRFSPRVHVNHPSDDN